jgi:hypothetical protein
MTFLKITFVTIVGWSLTISPSFGKGLDEIADQNPENPPAESEEEAAAPEQGEEEVEPAAEEAMVEAEKATPRPLSNKLYLATGGGWASASLPEGDWTSSGMSDISVGYLVSQTTFDLFATYRYAPAAIAGSVDGRAYRVVLETHNFGVVGFWKVGEKVKAAGSFEAGVLMTGVEALDGAEPKAEHVKSGGVATLGGGADWTIFEKVDLGPRLYAGFGSATIIQFGAQAAFFF